MYGTHATGSMVEEGALGCACRAWVLVRACHGSTTPVQLVVCVRVSCMCVCVREYEPMLTLYLDISACGWDVCFFVCLYVLSVGTINICLSVMGRSIALLLVAALVLSAAPEAAGTRYVPAVSSRSYPIPTYLA